MNLNLLSLFRIDYLSGFISISIVIFLVFILVYSLKFMKGKTGLLKYYFLIILTALASIGAVLANNLILLLVFWGAIGFTLYLLINMGDKVSDSAAKKTFIIVGGSDALLLLGIGIIYHLTGVLDDFGKIFTLPMSGIKLDLNSGLAVVAYICIAVACFAKAGAMPFHSWIPDCAESASVPVVAFLPAALDKLLGIYLLARISLDLFSMNQAMNVFLMITGAFTIIAAVMMALVQHNLKRLFGYHAVSQVGYMILGIGTGNPIGIAGALFHMLNHAIYKSCLFLTGGNVEIKTETSELNELGGLAKRMPITYICCLIASLSISGVPPLNGFISKWMIYQGVIQKLGESSIGIRMIIVLCLVAAMAGSALTLASFMKILHSIFLGQASNKISSGKQIKEVSWTMWISPVLLAVICIVFGVFAFLIPLRYIILPSLPVSYSILPYEFLGKWSPAFAAMLVFIGLCAGFLIFKLSRLSSSFRQDTPFVGGEASVLNKSRVSGTEFYNTVREIGVLKGIYKLAEAKCFDIYEQGQRAVFFVTDALRFLHNGVLPTYIVWCLLGMVLMFFVLIVLR